MNSVTVPTQAQLRELIRLRNSKPLERRKPRRSSGPAKPPAVLKNLAAGLSPEKKKELEKLLGVSL